MTTIYRPGQQIDHYQIIRLLGQGIASRVYLALDQQTQREVTLKFPSDDLVGGAAIFARYLREKAIGKRLNHPAIQRHLNQDEPRSADYIVLGYLHGCPLRMVMQNDAPALLPPEEAIRLLLQLCEALMYAHQHGVIHRDIKPENIFVRDTGEVVLLDFGIAHLVEKAKRTRHVLRWGLASSDLVGTPTYMAPERLRGDPGDARCDIYSSGVVLYELLCGYLPFPEQDGFDLTSKHWSHDPPDIVQANPALSPALATVVMRAIRRDPDKRYASIQDFAYDLSHLDEVTPVSYIPDPPVLGGQYRQILSILLVTLMIIFAIIGFGVLAQFVHTTAR